MTDPLADYYVEWAITERATSPRQAAEQAQHDQRAAEFNAVFDVRPETPGGEFVRIDLEEPPCAECNGTGYSDHVLCLQCDGTGQAIGD